MKTVQMYNYVITKDNYSSKNYFDYPCMETKVYLTHKILNLLWQWQFEEYVYHYYPEKNKSKVHCHL